MEGNEELLAKLKSVEDENKYLKAQVETKYPKPPLGLIPRNIWISKRLEDVQEAIARYFEANLLIPIEWIIEYNTLLKS